MPAPYDLQTLHRLRSRAQCPALPVFVTDRWDWQQKLVELGSLCIRVQSPSDHKHNWSALRGLHCMLLCDAEGGSERSRRYEQLSWSLLEGMPSQFEVFYRDVQYGRGGPSYTSLVLGVQEPIEKIMRRDALLYRLLKH